VPHSVNVPEVMMNPTLFKIIGTFVVFGGSVVLVPMTIKRLDRLLRVGTNAWRVSVETSKTKFAMRGANWSIMSAVVVTVLRVVTPCSGYSGCTAPVALLGLDTWRRFGKSCEYDALTFF